MTDTPCRALLMMPLLLPQLAPDTQMTGSSACAGRTDNPAVNASETLDNDAQTLAQCPPHRFRQQPMRPSFPATHSHARLHTSKTRSALRNERANRPFSDIFPITQGVGPLERGFQAAEADQAQTGAGAVQD